MVIRMTIGGSMFSMMGWSRFPGASATLRSCTLRIPTKAATHSNLIAATIPI